VTSTTFARAKSKKAKSKSQLTFFSFQTYNFKKTPRKMGKKKTTSVAVAGAASAAVVASASAAIAENIVVAYDGSGSTANNRFYHARVLQIVNEAEARAARDGVKLVLVFWDTEHKETSKARFLQINSHMTGGGGTDPTAIATWVTTTHFHGHLVIVTDGQVDNSGVVRSDAMLRAHGDDACWRFASVNVHLVDTGGCVNMSVSCPFTRVSPYTIFQHHGHSPAPIQLTRVSADDFAIVHALSTISTESAFMEHFDSIERAVVAATMGSSGDVTLRDTLLALKKRVVSEAASIAGAGGPAQGLAAALAANDASGALAAAATLTSEFYGEVPDDVDVPTFSARVSRLVSMCEGALKSTFDLSNLGAAIRSDRVRRAGQTIAPAAAVTVMAEADAAEEQGQGQEQGTRFECPVLLDDDAAAQDVLLLLADDTPPVLEGEDVGLVNALLDCPLNALAYPTIIAKLKAKLDYAISLNAWKSLVAPGVSVSGTSSSPLTRRPVSGGLCLGADEAHAKATTWALDRAILGGKRAGNPDLWFAVVWRILETDKPAWIDAAVVAKARAHMTWRLSYHSSFIALTGLPELPTTRVALKTAVWYVFAASALNPGPKREALRAHMFHAEPLLELLRLANLDALLPCDTLAHLRRLKGLACALAWTKKQGQRDAFANAVRALTQAAELVELETVSAFVRETVAGLTASRAYWIPVDGTASPEQVARVLSFLPPPLAACSVEELIAINALVDPQKALGDIALPFAFQAPHAEPAVSEWTDVYNDTTMVASMSAPHVQINSVTCRPRYHVPGALGPTATTWVDAVEAVFHVSPTKLLSLHKMFGVFVDRFGAYPHTIEDFLVFVALRVLSPNVEHKHLTLPTRIKDMATDIVWETRDVRAAVPDPKEFTRRWNASREIVARVAIENSMRVTP
jgi:hypothetical protein